MLLWLLQNNPARGGDRRRTFLVHAGRWSLSLWNALISGVFAPLRRPPFQVWAMPNSANLNPFLSIHAYDTLVTGSVNMALARHSVANASANRDLQDRSEDSAGSRSYDLGYALYLMPDRQRFWNFFFSSIFSLTMIICGYSDILTVASPWLIIVVIVPFFVFFVFRIPVLVNKIEVPPVVDSQVWFGLLILPPRIRPTIRSPRQWRWLAPFRHLPGSWRRWFDRRLLMMGKAARCRRSPRIKVSVPGLLRFVAFLCLPFWPTRSHHPMWHNELGAKSTLARRAMIDFFSPQAQKAYLDGGMVRWLVCFWTPVWSSFFVVYSLLLFSGPPFPGGTFDPTVSKTLPGVVWLVLVCLFATFEFRLLPGDMTLPSRRPREAFRMGNQALNYPGTLDRIQNGWIQKATALFFALFAMIYLVTAQIVAADIAKEPQPCIPVSEFGPVNVLADGISIHAACQSNK